MQKGIESMTVIWNKIKLLIFDKDKTVKSMTVNTLLRPIAMILSFLYTPLLLSYLGHEKYGIWTTLLSVINWINYCDVGIGHGLRNVLSVEISEGKYDEAKRSVSTAYVVLTVISSALWLLLILSVILFDWNKILGTQLNVDIVLYITFTFICINFVMALCNTLMYALQMSEKVSIRNIIVQVLNIVGVIVLQQIGKGELKYLAILFGATTSVVYIATSWRIFSQKEYLKPHLKLVQRNKIRDISGIGIKFFIIQMAGILLYSVDNILISNLYGAESVTPFNTVYKVFNMVASVYLALIVPIWSRTTVAIANKDFTWVKKTVKNLNLLLVPFYIVFILLLFTYEELAAIWLGEKLDYQNGLILINVIYFSVYLIGSLYAYVLNGIGSVNYQMWLNIAEAIVNIPLSIYLAVNCNMGVIGIKVATTILVGISAITLPFNLKYTIRRLETISDR